MRNVAVFAVLLLLLAACNKASVGRLPTDEHSLQGKWYYTEQFLSDGSPGRWFSIGPVTQWINLGQNGEISSNMPFFMEATRYELPDSGSIKFMIPSRPGGSFLYHYTIDSIRAELIMSPLTVLCIEGCAMKFTQ